jgi:hypothetical protein
MVMFVLLQFQFKGTGVLTSLPAGVQLTLVSATLPTSLPDILGSVIEVHLKEINKLAIVCGLLIIVMQQLHTCVIVFSVSVIWGLAETNCYVVPYNNMLRINASFLYVV